MIGPDLRWDLFLALLEDYPRLPPAFVLDAVKEAERAAALFGGGTTERDVVETAARRSLTDALAAFEEALSGEETGPRHSA